MPDTPIPSEVDFRYTKSNDYRQVFATGAWGGITPNGLIAAGLFCDVPPMPESVRHKITQGGGLGEETSRYPKELGPCVERILQVQILMAPETARTFAKWLEDKATEAENARVKDPGEGAL